MVFWANENTADGPFVKRPATPFPAFIHRIVHIFIVLKTANEKTATLERKILSAVNHFLTASKKEITQFMVSKCQACWMRRFNYINIFTSASTLLVWSALSLLCATRHCVHRFRHKSINFNFSFFDRRVSVCTYELLSYSMPSVVKPMVGQMLNAVENITLTKIAE